jgi:superfamily I DNA/RNA helicase
MAKASVNGRTLSGLNPAQAAAAAHGDGQLLIVAGAGTGKTRTLVHRVAHLLGRGADPSRMMLLTFTRRAAGEMLRRVRPEASATVRSRLIAETRRCTMRDLRSGGEAGARHPPEMRILRRRIGQPERAARPVRRSDD